jgi:hypothetical protein
LLFVFRYGWSLISSYITFPFLPTLTTLFLLKTTVVLPWYFLLPIGIMNALGYVIYRYRCASYFTKWAF